MNELISEYYEIMNDLEELKEVRNKLNFLKYEDLNRSKYHGDGDKLANIIQVLDQEIKTHDTLLSKFKARVDDFKSNCKHEYEKVYYHGSSSYEECRICGHIK